jgi:hypothetical protein
VPEQSRRNDVARALELVRGPVILSVGCGQNGGKSSKRPVCQKVDEVLNEVVNEVLNEVVNEVLNEVVKNALGYIYNIIYSLNFICFLKFHTVPQISPMRAQRAPVPQ